MAVESVVAQTVDRSATRELVRLRLRYAVVPTAEANCSIVDLDRVEPDADGRVRFEGDLWVEQPIDPAAGGRRLVVVAANRGRAGSAPFGHDFLLERGWSVAWCGWQWDIEPGPGLVGLTAPQATEAGRPIHGQVRVEILSDTAIPDRALSDPTGAFTRYPAADVDDPTAVLTERRWPGDERRVIDRSRWRFARLEGDGPVADDEHVWLEGGFSPHVYYEVVYTTRRCPVAGAGFLAFRDAAAFLRHGSVDGGNPCAGRFDHVVAYGASQSGRFMRGWLYEGLNRDEAGRQVFDGAQVEVAGGRRGEGNHRYAQPALMYPAGFSTLPPFATDDDRDGRAGLFDRQRTVGAVPRVVFTNAAWEYWLGDAGLTHIDPTGTRDLPDPPDVRHYFLAGIDHYGHMPDLKSRLPVANRPNTTDAGLLRRAAFVNLEAWVCDDLEPPPSQVPRLDDATAVPRREVLDAVATLPGLALPDPATLPSVCVTDLGPGAAGGVGRWPVVLGRPYPDLVSAVDADGNEVAGIRLPEVAVPVATHTGWNPRSPVAGLPATLYARCGSWLPFAATAADRRRTGDPRPSLQERYRDRGDYEDRLRRATAALVARRFLLAADAEEAVQRALRGYDAIVGAGVRSA